MSSAAQASFIALAARSIFSLWSPIGRFSI
jgi:hypothetical protein